jgi:hypothetical protein
MTSATYIIGIPAAPPVASTAGLVTSLVNGLYDRELPTTHGLFPMEMFP